MPEARWRRLSNTCPNKIDCPTFELTDRDTIAVVGAEMVSGDLQRLPVGPTEGAVETPSAVFEQAIRSYLEIKGVSADLPANWGVER
jgi:hypothetical protein